MHILQIILVRIQISYWFRLLILSKWTWLLLCNLCIILIIKLIFVHFWDESGRGLLWYTLDVVGFGVRTWLTFLEQVPNLNYCLSLLYQTCMDCALGQNLKLNIVVCWIWKKYDLNAKVDWGFLDCLTFLEQVPFNNI